MAVHTSFHQQFEGLQERFEGLRSRYDLDGVKLSIASLSKELEDPAVWSDIQRSTEINKKLAQSKLHLETFEAVEKKINDVAAFFDLYENIEDEHVANELRTLLADAESLLRSLEIKSYFSGKYDENDAILSIHAGQGGTEAMDWAQMVKRMYLRFFEKKGWKCVQLDENQGDEAGIKSCVLRVSGPFAYGYLKRETGAHRLVRQSP